MKINYKNVPTIVLDSRFEKLFNTYNKKTREYLHYLHSVADNPKIEHQKPKISHNSIERISNIIRAELSKRINMDGLDFYENYVCKFDGERNAYVNPVYRIVFKDMK
jgi:hypothetical protein